MELGEPDPTWQDFADDYLEYATGCVLEWGDASRQDPKALMMYEAWLVRTGRREPYGRSGPRAATPSEPAVQPATTSGGNLDWMRHVQASAIECGGKTQVALDRWRRVAPRVEVPCRPASDR